MTQPTVAVTGVAQRDVPPDSYILTARVAVAAGSSRAALDRLAARSSDLERVLDGLPVDVERLGVGSWQDERQWRAQRVLRVTGRDFDRLADVAGAIGRVADVAVEGPAWAIDRDNPAHAELQTEAVHAARARAQRYAAALDGTLGGLVELRDTNAGGGWVTQSARGAVGLAHSSAPGLETLDLTPTPVELSATVHARWYLDLPEAASSAE